MAGTGHCTDGLTGRVETGQERGIFRFGIGFFASLQSMRYLEVSRDGGGPYLVVLLPIRVTPFSLLGI